MCPLDDRSVERFDADIAGRPKLITGDTQTLFSGMRLLENCVVNIKNKSHSVTASIAVPDGGAAGVIVSQGGGVGGWCLYVHEGKLKYCYNFFGIEYYYVTADGPHPRRRARGAHGIRLRRRRIGQGRRRDALLRRDKPSAAGRVEQTEPMAFSCDEACDVGSDTGSPSSQDYGAHGNKFTGTIDRVIIDIGQDSHDHLVTAEDKLNISMSRQ